MATTVANIMDAAWQIMQDVMSGGDGTMYPVADQVKWINEAVEVIRQARPDSALADTGLTQRTIVPVTIAASAISLDDRWKTAIVEWVVSRAFMSDSEDKGDRRQGAEHQKLFMEALGR